MNMLPGKDHKKSETMYFENKDTLERESFNHNMLRPYCNNACSSQRSSLQDFKFDTIKCTEESKTGFPRFPKLLKPFMSNCDNSALETPKSHIPIQTVSSSENGHSSQKDKSHFREFKFYLIKSTEQSKTGFPLLPPALANFTNEYANFIHSMKSSSIPLQKNPENASSFSIPRIENFLNKSYNATKERKRLSQTCKHKPGIKNYCKHKDWDTSLSKYKTKVLKNSSVDLDSFNESNFLRSSKELTVEIKTITENKAKDALVHTSHKKDPAQKINSNIDGIFPKPRYSESEKTSQNELSVSCNSNDDKKRRRSSRACKPRPGIKHYCRHKNCAEISSKTNTHTNSPCSNKEQLNSQHSKTLNKAKKSFVLPSDQGNSSQSNNFEYDCNFPFTIFRYFKNDKTVQDMSCLSTKDNLSSITPVSATDDEAVFLSHLGLMRTTSQKKN